MNIKSLFFQDEKKALPWYKDKFFFLFYILQLVFSFLVAWYLFGPIFKITFKNANEAYYWWTQTFLCISVLLPYWILQILGLSAIKNISSLKKVLMTAGSYVKGLGVIVPAAIIFEKKITKKYNDVSWRAAMIVIFASLLVTIMEILFVDLVMNLVTYINAI